LLQCTSDDFNRNSQFKNRKSGERR
jgi:hypothetical protein